MEGFNNIKSLWQTSEFDNLPQIAEIEGIIYRYRQKQKLNNFLAIILVACILVTLFLLVSFAAFKMWSTYFGLVLFIGIAFNTFYSKIKRQDKLSDLETLSNNDFLIALEKEKNQTCIGKSRKQAILFIIWAIGFSFYIYEFISYSINYLLIGYGALMMIIMVIWFFYRPFMTKRYQKDIQKATSRINHLKWQINDDH